LEVALEHLQTLSGTLELPEGFDPSAISIDVEPADDRLIATSERFPWSESASTPPPGLSEEGPLETTH
jgi:hypothetical protein